MYEIQLNRERLVQEFEDNGLVSICRSGCDASTTRRLMGPN